MDAEHANVSYRAFADRDPYPFFERLRGEGHAHWDDGMKGWLLTRYEDCALVETREDLFAPIYNGFPGVEETQGKRGILLIKGEPHTQLHTVLINYFVRKAKEYRRHVVRPLAERQIDKFVASGRVELGSQFAQDIPIRVITAILGLPWEDEDWFQQAKLWSDEIVRWNETYGQDEAIRTAAVRAARELTSVLMPIIRDRHVHPQDDLISALWAAGPSIFEDWTEDDVMDQCKILFVAGSETTARLICSMVYLLVTHDALAKRIINERGTSLTGFVEETLRLFAPSQHRVRAATTDVELAGVSIKRGDLVYPLAAAANRDPERFPNPCEIDPKRKGNIHHLSFNVGPRLCVGAALARAEAYEAVDALLTRLEGLRLDPSSPAPKFAGFLFRSYQPLHLLFGPHGIAR